jgi:DNA-binding transcriptional MerR regulator
VFGIGEFSKITGLTVKTLRFYHEQGLIVPSWVDDQTGYRYYDSSKIELARVVVQLRELEFPLADIAEMLRQYDDEGDLLDYLDRQRQFIEERLSHSRRRFGRHLCGPPLLLHYDCEYHEDDADFEACMPIRQGTTKDGIEVRDLPGGPCVSLAHQGPYEELGRSYAVVLKYAHDHGREIEIPTREVYLKGPGMIFKGNPKKYLTEIQLMVKTP